MNRRQRRKQQQQKKRQQPQPNNLPPKPKSYGKVDMNPAIFRAGKFDMHKVSFVFSRGGMGDYICHIPAIEWIAEQNPHVHGRLFVNPPFTEVAEFILKKYDHWEVHPKNMLDKWVIEKGKHVYKGPCDDGEMIMNPGDLARKYITAPGAHLLDLGFMYFCNLQRAPKEYDRMPDLTHYESGKTWTGLNRRYAVVTPGATAKARSMPGFAINELCRYLNSKGVQPVFLGKKDFALTGKDSDYYAECADDIDWSLGLDLREQTSLLEAVEIIKNAELILGIDNGLLHFAGCTETPIIFGHTVTIPEHRRVRRPKGRVIDIALTKESLPCTGCQSNMRFIFGHRFKYCIYGDYACTEMLFANDCAYWKRAIDSVLNNGNY